MTNARKVALIVLIGLLVVVFTASARYLVNKYGKSVPAATAAETAEPAAAEDENEALAADFTVYNMEGEEVSLRDYIGKPVVVNFWATWCGPCKSELPAFEKAYRDYGDKVEFLMVNLTDGTMETVDGVKDFINTSGYKFPVYFDTMNSAGTAYSISAIPVTVFIDENGETIRTLTGAISETILINSLARMTD